MVVWRSFASYFQKEFRVVIFDLPGQGRAVRLSGNSVVDLDEQVAALHAVIAATRQSGSVSLAAASWGTLVAASYASRFPGTIDKLILGGFGTRKTKLMHSIISEGQAFYAANKTEHVGRLIVDKLASGVSQAQQNRIINQFRNLKIEQCEAFSAQCDFVQSVGSIDGLLDLKTIDAKTLIINGEDDVLLDPVDAQAAAHRIPDCQLRIVPDVGHFLHFEVSDVLDIYRDFLCDFPSPASP